MRNITNMIEDNKNFEFLWGIPQSMIVIFRNGEFYTNINLIDNSLKEALEVSNSFIKKEKNKYNNSMKH